MSRGLIQINDKYFEWSTVVDAPVTYGMTLVELKKYLKREYGNEGLDYLPQRLRRVEETGSSFLGSTLDDLLIYNRAGENEKRLSKQQIYEQYAKARGE